MKGIRYYGGWIGFVLMWITIFVPIPCLTIGVLDPVNKSNGKE